MPTPEELAKALRIGAGTDTPPAGPPEHYWTDQALFAGMGAKHAPIAALMQGPIAKRGAQDRNYHPTLADKLEDWRQTGWHAGADYSPRWEIDDSKATFDPQGTTLATALRHPELYKNYPQLANVAIGFVPPELRNQAAGRTLPGRIEYNPNRSPEDTLSTLLHEVQHLIQKEEGWQGGSSLGYEAAKLPPGTPGWAIANYLRNMGEVEARHTQQRRELTEAERKQAYPPLMEDVPRQFQIKEGQVPLDYNQINDYLNQNPGSQFERILKTYGAMK